jgi:hypothetical protein
MVVVILYFWAAMVGACRKFFCDRFDELEAQTLTAITVATVCAVPTLAGEQPVDVTLYLWVALFIASGSVCGLVSFLERAFPGSRQRPAAR